MSRIGALGWGSEDASGSAAHGRTYLITDAQPLLEHLARSPATAHYEEADIISVTELLWIRTLMDHRLSAEGCTPQAEWGAMLDAVLQENRP